MSEHKTIREWLNELPDGVREKAMANCGCAIDKVVAKENALKDAFIWLFTPQGHDYWQEVNDTFQGSDPRSRSIFDRIRAWGVEKGLTGPNGKATVAGQLDKLGEEFEELDDAVCYWIKAKGGLEQVVDFPAGESMLDQSNADAKDAIGDMTVVLVLLAERLGLRYEDCVESAYNEIKGRKGKMVDGVFVKEVVS